MDLSVRRNLLLPVWIVIWALAIIVLLDVSLLRAEPVEARVLSRELVRGNRSDLICVLTLGFDGQREQRRTDSGICNDLQPGMRGMLTRTRLLDRWLALYADDGRKLTGVLLENRLLTDVGFILLAILLPIAFRFELGHRARVAAQAAMAFEVFGVFYFLALLLG